MSQFVLSISINGSAPIQVLSMNASENALGLNPSGIAWHEEAAVKLERDEYDEITATAADGVCAQLTRKGRTLNLKAGRSVRILAHDTIQVSDAKFEITAVKKVNSAKTTRFNLKTLTKSAMKVLATALLASLFVACEDSDDDRNGVSGSEIIDVDRYGGAEDYVPEDGEAGGSKVYGPDDVYDGTKPNDSDDDENTDVDVQPEAGVMPYIPDDSDDDDDENTDVDVQPEAGVMPYIPDDSDDDEDSDDGSN